MFRGFCWGTFLSPSWWAQEHLWPDWNCCCSHARHSLCFYFYVYILGEFFCCFQRADEQTSSLLVFHNYIWSVQLDLFIGLDQHVPECSRYFVFDDCWWHMFIIFVLHFDVLSACRMPMEVCCCLVVPGKLQASWDQVSYCLLMLIANSAHWIGTIFQDLISIGICFDALIFNSNNESFCF